jgi:hypothetical protein
VTAWDDHEWGVAETHLDREAEAHPLHDPVGPWRCEADVADVLAVMIDGQDAVHIVDVAAGGGGMRPMTATTKQAVFNRVRWALRLDPVAYAAALDRPVPEVKRMALPASPRWALVGFSLTWAAGTGALAAWLATRGPWGRLAALGATYASAVAAWCIVCANRRVFVTDAR